MRTFVLAKHGFLFFQNNPYGPEGPGAAINLPYPPAGNLSGLLIPSAPPNEEASPSSAPPGHTIAPPSYEDVMADSTC